MALSKINTNQIVDGAVATADIADGLITTAKLADGAVTTAKITDGNITTAKVADDAVTNAKVADDAINTAQIADNAVANAQMADNAVGTSEIADDAVTTAKVNPAQTDITSVGTLSGLTVGDNAGGDVSLTTNSQAGTQASPLNMDINFKGYNNNTMATIRSHDESSSTGHGELQFHTTKNGVGSSEKMNIDHDGNTKIRNANATGPILDIGTTSTSVADDGVIGGIDFSSGSASTVNGRLHCKQYDTSENAGYFSNELRAPNGNSLGEVSREFISQNAHGGVHVKRPMPANIFYYREAWKSANVGAGTTTNLFKINQNDYYMSVSCTVEIMMLDTNYPTGSALRVYGLCASTHQGRSTVLSKYTSMHDMGSYQNNVNEIGSDNFYFNTDITTSKSAGSNNGVVQIRVTTGTLLQASCTIRLHGMFLNARFEDQPITANL